MNGSIMRAKLSLLGAGLLISALIASTAPAATASPSPPPPTDTPAPTLPPPTEQEAQQTDANELQASGYDVTADEVAASNNFNLLVTEIDLNYSEFYSTASFSDEKGSPPRIAFSGEVPPEAQELIDTSGLKIDVVSNSGISESERARIDDTISTKLAQAHIAASCEQSSVVTVSPADGTTEVLTACDALAEKFNDVQAKTPLDVPPVTFIAAENNPVEPEVMSGGTKLTSCTAGFTVRNDRTREKGITTANHCNDTQTYEGTTPLTLKGYGLPIQLDFQWHMGNRTVWSHFVATKVNGVQQNRLQTGSALPTHFSTICKYGQVTGYGCSPVRSGPHTVLSSDGHTYKQIYTTNSYITASGDSGGPWFTGNTAVGIHHGSFFPNNGDPTRSSFTPLVRVEQQTDLRLLIGCTSPC